MTVADTLRNLDAEQDLIGCVLYENDALRLIDGIEPRHFSEPLHERLWAAVVARISAGRVAEPRGISAEFEADPAFVALGGARYLADLVDAAPPARVAPELAEAVRDAAIRRELVGIAKAITQAAPDRTVSGFDHLAIAEQAVGALARDCAPSEANIIDARTAAEQTLDEIEQEAHVGRARGFFCGLRCIDRRLRGLRPGQLVVIAGRPSMAKTALARQIAKGAAERNPGTAFAFFALEMQRRELDERTLSELSFRHGPEWIPYQNMSGDRLDPDQRRALRELARRVPANLVIDDSPVLTVDYVRRRVWALKRKGALGAVFIDYLQIMSRPAANGRNDAAVVGEMTAALKRLAREAEVCIVLLSQINRGVESRDDKRPQLSDLRESGAIEQDANAVLFPYREVYYLERAEPEAGTAKHQEWQQKVAERFRRMDVICAKNRQGAVGTDHQEYIAECDAITDVAEDRHG